jgi:hypothetical protein
MRIYSKVLFSLSFRTKILKSLFISAVLAYITGSFTNLLCLVKLYILMQMNQAYRLYNTEGNENVLMNNKFRKILTSFTVLS